MASFQNRMQSALKERQRKGTLRRLPADPSRSITNDPSSPDFSSNDYLGFAHNHRIVQKSFPTVGSSFPSGSTGSRLLSGDSFHFHFLERHLAKVHGATSSLLFNSGYDANLSVVSCLAADVILYDALIHNSLHMGIRLWKSAGKERVAIPFRHNSLSDLQAKLQEHQHEDKLVVVLVESVYSMDGDIAPVEDMLDMAQAYNAVVMVDEAHGWGVLGPTGLGALEKGNMIQHPALAFAVYTYGKAAGAHGALVCCPSTIAREYLVNYAYPFIYSTALPLHSLNCIYNAYQTLQSPQGVQSRHQLQAMIAQFRRDMRQLRLLPSTTPIQALIVPGNEACTALCERVYRDSGIRLFPIKSPTVPAGQERVRIVLHAHNTADEIARLVQSLQQAARTEGTRDDHSKL